MEFFITAGLLIVVGVIWIGAEIAGAMLLGALLTPVFRFLGRWSKRAAEWVDDRTGMADPEQSPYVRVFARRLGSRNPKLRMNAAKKLGAYQDSSAVPALQKAAARFQNDGALMQLVIRALIRLDDPRALPTLRLLGQHADPKVAAEARAAVTLMEPKSTLLRTAASPDTTKETLLRGARSSVSVEEEQLVRPGQLG